jgi:transforming growth factor-beta-induced protein
MILKRKNPLLVSAKILLLTLAFSVVTISCSDDDDNSPDTTSDTILGLAQATSDLSTLEAVLELYPDLETLLSGSTEYTVFAPTNAAFAEFLTAIGQTSATAIPEDVLRTVLEYHVVAGEVTSSQLTTGNVATAGGENIAVNVASGVVLNGNTNVTAANVQASNGVVHIVDKVLVPPSILPVVGTIVAPAYFNKDFSTLVSAVVQAGLLNTLLSDDNELTLFAPTNAAFTAAGVTLPANNPTNNAALAEILKYHVIAGEDEVTSGDIATGSSSATTLSGPIYLSKGAAGVFINGTSQVTIADIQASNGVVHVINRTLVEPTQTIADIAVGYTTATTPEFTQLVAALSKVPALLTAADSEGNLTVFAPTDAAFQALYTALGVANINELETAIGNAKLAQVLQHHIVGARVFSTDLVSGNVNTLNEGDPVTINVTNLTVTDAAGRPAAALVPSLLNVHATNGVIHVIDKVLIPTGIL